MSQQRDRDQNSKGQQRQLPACPTPKTTQHPHGVQSQTDRVYKPTLTYQSQTWALTKSLEKKITTCEMWCLRRTINKTRHDRIKNTDIREMVETTPILHRIQRQRIRWFGHLTHMAPHQLASRAYNTKVSGYKPRGRPRKTWIEGVKETLRTHNFPPTQAFKLAADRKLFLPSMPRMVEEDG